MTRPVLDDAFGHHVWATLRVIDTCLELDPEHLATAVPGTYGSILDTLRHTVGADRGYLFALTGGRVTTIEEEGMDLAELRAVMASDGPEWSAVVRPRIYPTWSSSATAMTAPRATHRWASASRRRYITERIIEARSAPRSTSLGVEPPAIDAWDFAWKDGRLVDIPPPS